MKIAKTIVEAQFADSTLTSLLPINISELFY